MARVGMAVLADHLQQRSSSDVIPPVSRFVGLFEEHGGSSAGTGQSSQTCVAFIIGLIEGAEGSHLLNESPGGIARLREVSLPRGQRLPDDVFEWMHFVYFPLIGLRARRTH